MSSKLLGDMTAEGDNNATITLPSGEVVSIPTSQLGDLFTGDRNDDDMTGDVSHLLGDKEVTELGTPDMGDLFTGDANRRLGKSFGAFLPNTPAIATVAGKKPTTAQKTAVNVLKTIPGAVLATKVLSPCMINNGLINNAPTRAMVQGTSFIETIRRFETQYPGSTRTQTFNNPTYPLPVTFAAPAVSGEVTFCPVVLIQIAVARQFTIPNAEIIVNLVGVNESGANVDARRWSFLLSQALSSTFIAMIPFIEVSSTIYPCIVRASAAPNALTVNIVTGPAEANIRVFLPGMDSSQYQMFKEGLGISMPTSRVTDYTTQRQ